MHADIGMIIAIIGTGASIIGVVVAMMFWVRSEANTLRSEAKEDRKEFLQISRNLEFAVMAIKDEMRDFHRQIIDIQKKIT